MNRKDIIDVARQIIIDMAYDPALQINTFAMVDDGIDLKHASFGKSYEDYNEGRFWSRTWVNSGADSSKVQGEWPLLFLEQRTLDLPCIDSNEMTLHFYFVLADKITCDSCPPELSRTSDQVLVNTLIMLRRFFKELVTYRHYTYVKDGENLQTWATEGRMNHLLSTSEISSITGWDEDFDSLLQNPSPINVTQWGNFENIRAHSAKISITVCDITNGEFDYSKTKASEIAYGKCINC